jgi:hypothetical protein
MALRSSQRSIAIRRPSVGVNERPRAVADDCGHAGLHQRRDHRACRTARAQHDGRSCRRLPAGRAFGEGRQEAEAVAVAALQRAVGLLDHRVHRADPHRVGVEMVEERHDVDLVRQGKIAAARVGRAFQERHERFECCARGLHRQAPIMAVDTVLPEPEALQRGRARMVHGPADDRGEGASLGFGKKRIVSVHAAFSSPMPCSARNASSGNSGRPRIVK